MTTYAHTHTLKNKKIKIMTARSPFIQMEIVTGDTMSLNNKRLEIKTDITAALYSLNYFFSFQVDTHSRIH